MIFFWKSKATDVCVNYLGKGQLKPSLMSFYLSQYIMAMIYEWSSMEFSILQSAKAIPMIFHTRF